MLTTKSPKGLGRHIHVAVREIVFLYKGEGEMYFNDNWVPVKAGDLHAAAAWPRLPVRFPGKN